MELIISAVLPVIRAGSRRQWQRRGRQALPNCGQRGRDLKIGGDVRFSDKMHAGLGPEGQVYITRRPDSRYYPDCIHYRRNALEQDAKRVHC